MRHNIALHDLQAFCELASAGQFSAAADRLALTPSALTKRIAKLEDALGGRLVERTTRTMALTPLGEHFFERAEPLLHALQDCLRNTRRIAAGQEGSLTIACLASVSHSLFPLALMAFRQQHPGIQVRLWDSSALRVRAAVLERSVDFGITTILTPHQDIHSELIASDGYRLVCPRSHALADRRQVSWQEIAEYDIMGFDPQSATRRHIDGILHGYGIRMRWFYEVDQLSTMIGYLQHSTLPAVLPGLLPEQLGHLATIPISGPDIRRQIHLVKRRDTSLSATAEVLWQCVRDNATRTLPVGQAGIGAN